MTCLLHTPDASSGVMVPRGKDSRRSLRFRAIFLALGSQMIDCDTHQALMLPYLIVMQTDPESLACLWMREDGSGQYRARYLGGEIQNLLPILVIVPNGLCVARFPHVPSSRFSRRPRIFLHILCCFGAAVARPTLEQLELSTVRLIPLP